MININELKFDEKGLIPAIVIDGATNKVLTLAYMNEESLKISLEKTNGLEVFHLGIVLGDVLLVVKGGQGIVELAHGSLDNSLVH